MNCFNIDSSGGTVLSSSLVICREGRCSFNLEGEHYELAKSSAIVLRKGQFVADFRASEDFSATCIEAPAQFLAASEKEVIEHKDRRTELFANFKQLLKDHYTCEHDALFYARKLHITPKYLAMISKELSGLSVKELIDRALLRDASFMLRNTDRTISQIAGALHFESPELFGKFFKRMSNLSPRQFRLMSSETNE